MQRAPSRFVAGDRPSAGPANETRRPFRASFFGRLALPPTLGRPSAAIRGKLMDEAGRRWRARAHTKPTIKPSSSDVAVLAELRPQEKRRSSSYKHPLGTEQTIPRRRRLRRRSNQSIDIALHRWPSFFFRARSVINERAAGFGSSITRCLDSTALIYPGASRELLALADEVRPGAKKRRDKALSLSL